MKLHETPQYQKGAQGEDIVLRCLVRDGYFVVPTRDFTTAHERAPLMHHKHDALILPDFACFRDGRGVWVDAKTKEHPNLYRLTDTLEHGIDTRLAMQYLRIQEETGMPAWLVFVEVCSGQLLCGRLDELVQRCRWYEGNGYRPMANFARHDLREVSPDIPGALGGMFG